MSKHLEEFLKRNRELAEAASPAGKAWETHPTGLLPEEMRGIGIMGSHNRTPYIGKHDAAFVSASRTSLPLALEMLEVACEALRKIGYTQDVSPADPETGGPCRIATANSRNRRILEAQEALAALEEKAGRG